MIVAPPLLAGAVNATLAEVELVEVAVPIVGAPGTVEILPAKPMDFKLPAARVIIVGIGYLASE